MKSHDFLIVVEKGETNYGAYSPDLPGCVAVGKTRRAALASMKEAIALHIEGMLEEGFPIPKPSSTTKVITMNVPNKRDLKSSATKRVVRSRKPSARTYTSR